MPKLVAVRRWLTCLVLTGRRKGSEGHGERMQFMSQLSTVFEELLPLNYRFTLIMLLSRTDYKTSLDVCLVNRLHLYKWDENDASNPGRRKLEASSFQTTLLQRL
ncbi:hypothetical protein IW261DRAFT_998106 [Armillaria novae-zelandiae]|uniref:Uncharacterized protein n=1 Tax=Armillaria novae-zelandiae TaxID=153914 RepID=A0AA39NS51_9AGAR|nr:hypothetical protein IW261DRAFT_998106 [Armillaria novae-zelandiae]